jgi:hypothetical protein
LLVFRFSFFFFSFFFPKKEDCRNSGTRGFRSCHQELHTSITATRVMTAQQHPHPSQSHRSPRLSSKSAPSVVCSTSRGHTVFSTGITTCSQSKICSGFLETPVRPSFWTHNPWQDSVRKCLSSSTVGLYISSWHNFKKVLLKVQKIRLRIENTSS